MSRISDCRLCGKVNAQIEIKKAGASGTETSYAPAPEGYGAGFVARIYPTAMRLVFQSANETRDRGWAGEDKEATLCASCSGPLLDYLREKGILAHTPPKPDPA
jgi:hypothetical protein